MPGGETSGLEARSTCETTAPIRARVSEPDYLRPGSAPGQSRAWASASVGDRLPSFRQVGSSLPTQPRRRYLRQEPRPKAPFPPVPSVPGPGLRGARSIPKSGKPAAVSDFREPPSYWVSSPATAVETTDAGRTGQGAALCQFATRHGLEPRGRRHSELTVTTLSHASEKSGYSSHLWIKQNFFVARRRTNWVRPELPAAAARVPTPLFSGPILE